MEKHEDRISPVDGMTDSIKTENDKSSIYSLFEELERVMVEVNEYYQKLEELERMERKKRLNELITDERMKLQQLKEQIHDWNSVSEMDVGETMVTDENEEFVNLKIDFAITDKEEKDYDDDDDDDDDDDEDEDVVCDDVSDNGDFIDDNKTKNVKIEAIKPENKTNYKPTKLRLNDPKPANLVQACKECNEVVSSKWKLKRHVEAHVVNTTNICDTCGLSFVSENILLIHNQKHRNQASVSTNDTKLYSSICDKNPPSNTTEETQRNSSTRDRNTNNDDDSHGNTTRKDKFYCSTCDRFYNKRKYLEIHKLKIHGKKEEDRALWCSFCEIDFSDMINFAEHAKEHLTDRPLYCIICETTFNKRSKLMRHINSHSGQKPFSCSECLKLFNSKYTLNIHIRNIHNIYRCRVCNETFSTGILLNHHKKTHLEEKNYMCSYCRKSFSTIARLKEHKIKHIQVEKKYQCDTCGLRFRTVTILKVHIVTHTGEKQFACEECGKCYSQAASLRRHRQAHQELGTYQCEICSKMFKTQPGLSRHLFIHTGVKPYECDECGKSFNQKGNLVIHQRKHSGVRPYKCPTCFKSFMYSGLCNDHIKTHEQDQYNNNYASNIIPFNQY